MKKIIATINAFCNNPKLRRKFLCLVTRICGFV